MKEKKLTRHEIIYISLAIRDAYMGFDQEDYCEEGMARCGKCFGCVQYKNQKRAYRIIKNLLPIKKN